MVPKILIVITILLPFCEEIKANGGEQCPTYCNCDLFENLNRADCSARQLITPNVEVPNGVELLDLSYNDITTLDNSCFEGLIFLTNLTLKNNALHTIYLEAFSPLRELQFVDLSYNRLEYFDDRIFETNTKLTRLDLSGNKFMSLQNKPFLKTNSIQFLRLHDAQVSHIYPLTFKEMPALRDIDLSQNLMITLNAARFTALRELERLNLEENRWKCDKSLFTAVKILQEHGIRIKLSICGITELDTDSINAPRPPHMFERMMLAPPSQMTLKEFIPLEDVWKPKKKVISETNEGILCELQSPAKICQLHSSCLTHLKMLMSERASGDIPSRGQYSENDLKFVFLTGISMGVAVVVCLFTCGICIKRCFATQKPVLQRHEEGLREVPRLARHIPIPPPVPPRHRRSNRRSGNVPPLNRSLSSPARRTPSGDGNRTDFATFISRFFERPSRHQYYRTINENTAYMIRRLSQSNLFNSRNSGGARVDNDVDHSRNDNRSSEERCLRRPETPPPSYGDVIKP